LARCLIIGCGCRGCLLARELVGQGHAVRGTTRNPARRPEIEAAGAQAVVADPDRVGTIIGALEHVTVAVVLLGSAVGPPAALAELHGPRLETLLSRMVDTTIKGVVYEARGAVDPELLAAGSASVLAFQERARARVAVLEADPAARETWLPEALAAVEAVLALR
jgi:Trk K+ transport system NAD-binding subunit